MASNTGAASEADRLITFSTLAVAVCCSSASRASLNSRAFFERDQGLRRESLRERDLPVRERSGLVASEREDAPDHAILGQRNAKGRDRLAQFDARDGKGLSLPIASRGPEILDMNEGTLAGISAQQDADRQGGGHRVIDECLRQGGGAADGRAWSPSTIQSPPPLASQKRIAFLTISSNTGSSSSGRALMRLSTSELAA